MSGEKSGDNRLFQIIMVLITSVVAPLIVFFVTNSAKNNAATAIVATATAPSNEQGQQSTAVLPAEATAPAQPTSATAAPVQPTNAPAQPGGVQNPTGLIPAGTAAVVDNLSLTVKTEDVVVDGSGIRVTLHVTNLGADTRTLVLTPGSVTVKDERKTYGPMLGDKKTGCTREDLNQNKSIVINSGASAEITSSQTKQPATWCAPGQNNLIPAFVGPLSKETTKLQIQINGVGPFKGFAFEVPIKK